MRAVPGWRNFEVYVNELLGLEGTIASGSQFHDPGDGVDRRHHTETDFALMVDAKYSERASFSVTAKFMGQWVDKAQEQGKRFAMPIRLWPRGTLSPRDYLVISLDDFAELLDKVRAGGR